MKKHILIVIFAAVLCIFAGCGIEEKGNFLFRENLQNDRSTEEMEETEETVEDSAWKLNYESIELYTEDFVSMNLIASSEEGIKEGVSWKSEDENIAAVDDSGTVTAKGIGSTTVTAMYHGVSQSCSVVVSDFDKSYAESIDAYAEFLRGGTATIASESGLTKIILDKWVVCDLGDSSIKELIVVDGTTLYIFTYRMGEVCNTGEKAWVEKPNEDNKEVDYFYFDGADDRAVCYCDKELNYFGKQSVMSIWIENGQTCFLRYYNLNAGEVEACFTDKSEEGYYRYALCDNTEEIIQKCLMPYKDRSFQEDEQRENSEEEESDEEEREDSAGEEDAEQEADGEEETDSGGHQYTLIAADVTWQEAFDDCISRGGYLAQINSEEEYQAVIQMIEEEDKQNLHFYLGGRRDIDSRKYYWVDKDNELSGEVLNPEENSWASSHWMENEPSFTSEEDQEMYMNMIYYQENWVFNDVPMDITVYYPGKTGYICEFERQEE